MATRNTKKILGTVLALGAATGAIVFGSFAAWTATTSNNNNSVSTGSITLSTDKPTSGAVITATNIKPGDAGSQTVVVTNGGSIPLDLTLTKDVTANGATSGELEVQIEDTTTPGSETCIQPAGAGACSTWADWGTTLTNGAAGSLAASGSRTYTVRWRLNTASTNADQGTTNTFDLDWTGTPS